MKKLIIKKSQMKEFDKKLFKVKIPKEILEEETEEEFKLKDINKYKLDEEAEKHDNIYREASKIYAKKVRLKYDAELELGIVKDELAEEIRKHPTNWDLKKDERLTDALINRVIVRDERYKIAYHKYIDAKTESVEWEGVKSSLEQRGWMIKLLYEMWKDAYFK